MPGTVRYTDDSNTSLSLWAKRRRAKTRTQVEVPEQSMRGSKKGIQRDFSGRMVKNMPANAGDSSSIPGPGIFHRIFCGTTKPMSRNYQVQALQLESSLCIAMKTQHSQK